MSDIYERCSFFTKAEFKMGPQKTMQNCRSHCVAQIGELFLIFQAGLELNFTSATLCKAVSWWKASSHHYARSASVSLLLIFPLDKQTPPTPEEMGRCDSVYLSEVGDTQVVVFKHGKME